MTPEDNVLNIDLDLLLDATWKLQHRLAREATDESWFGDRTALAGWDAQVTA